MLENPALLKELGILYPKHTLTISGVSAGNWGAIFDKNEKKQPSKTKIDKLIKQFNSSDAQTLLLSSENFFGRISSLAEAIPEARFIFYLRNPLSLAESLYNQNVKNSGETEPFAIKTRRPNFGTIGHLLDFAKSYGTDRIIVRYFHPQFYHRGNIINDVLEALGINYDQDIPPQKVNISYTLESLETKRFLNNFDLSPFADYSLNNLLQQNQVGTLKYSFLKPEEYRRHLQHVIDELELFFKQIPCPSSNKFLEATKRSAQKKHVEQSIGTTEFITVRDYIFSQNTLLYYHICGKIASNSSAYSVDKNMSKVFLERYHKSATKQLWYQFRFYLQKEIFINQLRAKKLFAYLHFKCIVFNLCGMILIL